MKILQRKEMRPLAMPAIVSNKILSVRADGGVSAEVIKEVQAFGTQLKEFDAANKVAIASAQAVAEASGTEAAGALATAEAAVQNVEKIAANLLELEQSFADKANAGQSIPHQTVGDILINSEAYKAMIPTPGTNVDAGFKLRVEANTLSGQGGSPVVNEDTLVPIDRKPGIIPGTFRALRITDLLTNVPTTQNQYEFVRELLFTNNAAETAEAAAKPESVLTFEKASVAVRTIAHFIKATNQIIADAPALRSYVDNRLLYGVNLREDSQLIVGDGTGENISGMTIAANRTAFTPTTGDTAIDSVNRAKYTLIGADYQPNGILMNPADWGAIERLKATTNEYLVGNPFGQLVPTLWGLPIVLSNNMTSGSFMEADFALAYDYVSRMTTTVDLGFVNDDFTRNLITIRAEKRSALATLKPAASYFGSLTV